MFQAHFWKVEGEKGQDNMFPALKGLIASNVALSVWICPFLSLLTSLIKNFFEAPSPFPV